MKGGLVVGLTGASGFLGRPLAARLAAAGHTVVPIPREMGALPGLDALVHLAGESVAGLWTAGKRRAILESRVEGTRRLVERMRELRRPPAVFVSASATGLYGHRPGEVLEDDAGPGSGFRSEVCRAWEAEAREAEKFGVRTVLLRFGSVLDPDGGYLGRMTPFLRRGLCFVLGRGSDRFPWISRTDAVRLVEFALATPGLAGPVNAVAPRSATQKEFARAAAALFRRHVLGRVPRRLLRAVLGEFARAFIDSQDVRPAKALRHGFVFLHPDLETWTPSLALEIPR
jgi:hypothetical protein